MLYYKTKQMDKIKDFFTGHHNNQQNHQDGDSQKINNPVTKKTIVNKKEEQHTENVNKDVHVTDVYQKIQPIYEHKINDIKIDEHTVQEKDKIVNNNRNYKVFENGVESTSVVNPTETTVVKKNEPVINENVIHHTVEHIQPVIHKTIVNPIQTQIHHQRHEIINQEPNVHSVVENKPISIDEFNKTLNK